MEGMFNLTWLVPLPPFAAFVVIVLFLNTNKRASSLVAIGAAALSLFLGWLIAFSAFFTDHFGAHPINERLFGIPTGNSEIAIGYALDPANALMLFMVSFLLLMIFIYSSGYMTFPGHLRKADYPVAAQQNKDPRYSRFFAYISLFAVGMLGLVISNDLITFFVFWEIMGLCSYLLIGFWFEKPSAKAAALKAFMTTRVGDTIMLIGMMLLYINSEPSSLRFSELFSPENLHHLSHTTIGVLALFPGVPLISLITFLIFFGTIGKSSQFPLHVWLPDAMEGPTPVSAMIHAATMVSAGVFLLVRMFPLFAEAAHIGSGTNTFVAFIGAFTAIFAATIAMAQWDIKRVLAYSTISQLGFMVAAIGIGAYVAALFHLLTHAFFKGLLFLSSGSVIHGVEHGAHHGHEDHGHDAHHHAPALIQRADGVLNPTDPQDMRNMGGLLGRMPRTGWAFIIGGLALSGFPILTAGFWSKDEILSSAWTGGNQVVFWTLAVAAFLTAFYTMRQISLTFLGKARTEMAAHAPESVPSMTIPLMLISVFAVVGGWIGIPKDFPLIGGILPNWIEHFMEPYVEYLEMHVLHPEFGWVPLTVSLVVALGGLTAGYLVYGRGLKEGQVDPVRKLLGPVWMLWHHKYYIDEIYQDSILAFVPAFSKFLALVDNKWVIDPIVNAVGRLGVFLSTVLAEFDRIVVDGMVNGAGWLASRTGSALRNIQDGKVQVYLLVGMVALTLWLLFNMMPLILTLV